MKTWRIHQQGPDESRYIVAEDGLFIARMDTEASDEEWRLAAVAPDLLALVAALTMTAEHSQDDLEPETIALLDKAGRYLDGLKLVYPSPDEAYAHCMALEVQP
jgi:hypothetical protein